MSPFVANDTLALASSTSIDKAVSWPIILWALLPIAFNSMTQPAGRIAINITAEHSFYLRASPFLCVLEAFAVLFQFACLTIRTGNPRIAINRIAPAKLHISTDVGRTQLQELQNNDIFRAMLFLLGVLPQAFKVYACKGIPASQTWASLYLGSWTVLELLVVQPARYGAVEDPEHPNSERTSFSIDPLVELLCYIAIHYCDFMALHFMYVRVEKERQTHNPPPTTWKDHVTLFGVGAFYLLLLCARITGLGSALFEKFIYCFYAIFVLDFNLSERLWLFALRSGRFLAVIGVDKPTTEDQADLPSLKEYTRFGSVAFFLMHILTAVGSYRFMYEPAGTSKPAWTEYLG
ncbi:MAG: hypothetical protein L6R38_005750 [Xanthoria sp. 2 TBL-2021]|nr:MAG: hypothetical protein L6R38_005750 [Xanthoria sp. 2 TBL-2021]